MRPARLFALPLLAALAIAPPRPARAGVELHAHLFMEHAMGWAFRGGFDTELRASDWRARMASQANARTLRESGLAIAVASLYAHPLFRGDLRQAVRDQLDAADAFVAANPGWILARGAEEARGAVRAGRSALVLSLEGAAGVLETPADFDEFVERRGIRIVTPLHLTDDRFGGAAFMRGPLLAFNPLALLRSLAGAGMRDESGTRLNDRGLNDAGRALIDELTRRRVWIDLSHASDAATREILPRLAAAGQPLLYTHTVLRRYHRAERGLSEALLDEVGRTRGVVGLMPSDEYLSGTPGEPETRCGHGIARFARQFREIAARIGEERVASGSDFNGGIRHLPPGCAPGTSIDGEGLWHVGQLGELYRALAARGAASAGQRDAAVTAFLEAWGRVRP